MPRRVIGLIGVQPVDQRTQVREKPGEANDVGIRWYAKGIMINERLGMQTGGVVCVSITSDRSGRGQDTFSPGNHNRRTCCLASAAV